MSSKKCPCGSGKNIKECCGYKENLIDLDKYRWRRAGRHLRRKLAEFADNDVFMDEVETAREIFFSAMDPELVDEEDDLMLERFFEWFIFDYNIQGKTILGYFSLAGKLSNEEKELLEQWKKAKSSFYQVMDISKDFVIVLQDLIRNHKVEVNDRNAAQELEPGHILLMRMLPVSDDYEFSTGGLVLPPHCKNYLVSKIKQDAERYWNNNGKRGDWDAFLTDRNHELNALVVEMETIWGFAMENGEVNSLLHSDDNHMAGMAQQVTNIFLDYFYERWVNEPMDVLHGKTPMEASKNKKGREKLQTLLRELGKIEKARAQKGEPYYDLSRLRRKLHLPVESLGKKRPIYQDGQQEETNYAGVAELIRDGLNKMGYRDQQVDNALEMWQSYSNQARPTFRKPGAWAAAVIYAVARLLGDETVSQNELASMFNVSPSTISVNYRSICRTLQLN